MKKYPAAKPHIGKKEEAYVLKALRSGRLSIGPFVEAFEKKFAREVGAKHAIAVSSGTAGLHVALVAAGIGPGDEVITSPFSFIASANAILFVGAKPVFVDIDPRTYNLDASHIEKKITKRTKAILPVHIFGQPTDMTTVMRVARKHKLVVIEDACESLLSTWKGTSAGTFGDAGVFAFYANKQMTTGEGGMIVTNDDRMNEACRSLRNQGRAPDMQWLDHDRVGYNYRLDELSSALGLAQIEKIDFLIAKRKEIAKWYTEALAPYGDLIVSPYTDPRGTHTWFVYVVRIKDARISRDEVMKKLQRRGISTRPYLPSIHLFDVYRKFGFKDGAFPIAEKTSLGTMALPLYIGLTKKDIHHIVKTLADIVHSYE